MSIDGVPFRGVNEYRTVAYMEKVRFKAAVDQYRRLMEGVAEKVRWGSADWASDVWLEGSRCCLKIVEEYLPTGSNVLDFGCGVGFMAVLLNEMGYEVTGIDIDVGGQQEAVESAFSAPWGTWQFEKAHPEFLEDCWNKTAARFGITFRSFDGRHIPYASESFDAVLAHAVIEHMKPDILQEVLREIRRVLRDGGVFLILRTPRKGSYLEKIFRLRFLRNYSHQILYDESELAELVTGEGFSLMQKGVTDMFPAFPPYGLRAYNAISPLLIRLDALLLRTPLKRYAHHMSMVFRKEPDSGRVCAKGRV
jgi:SAM-dependent methyltransferase